MEKNEEEKRRIEIAKDLGKNILKFRKEKGYTREELAEKSNLSANYIYGLEIGTYLPGCIALIDLSNARDITISQLLAKYLNNDRKDTIDKISTQITKLSDRDLELIINIIDFLESKNI